MSRIGIEEYNKRYCEVKLEEAGIHPTGDDKVGLLKDYVHTYTMAEEAEGGGSNKYDTGCCRVHKDYATRFSTDCVHVQDYKNPTTTESFSYFLKRFK